MVLSTDSQYVRQGITQWIHNWKKRGWKTADKKPVKNVDLWKRLDAALGQHQIKWEWVKGHAGHPENERCDELARAAAISPHAGRRRLPAGELIFPVRATAGWRLRPAAAASFAFPDFIGFSVKRNGSFPRDDHLQTSQSRQMSA